MDPPLVLPAIGHALGGSPATEEDDLAPSVISPDELKSLPDPVDSNRGQPDLPHPPVTDSESLLGAGVNPTARITSGATSNDNPGTMFGDTQDDSLPDQTRSAGHAIAGRGTGNGSGRLWPKTRGTARHASDGLRWVNVTSYLGNVSASSRQRQFAQFGA